MTERGCDQYLIYYIHDLWTEPGASQKIWELLVDVDDEFVPALSSREGPTDTDLHDVEIDPAARPTSYFKELLNQRSFVAEHAGDVVGFLSYREDYLVPEIGEQSSTYVSTIAVHPAHRRVGLARKLYMALDAHLGDPERWRYRTTIRTWSTNLGHNKLVRSLGYEEVGRVVNGRGKGVDTIIYAL